METHILVDMHPCLPGAGYSCVEFFATSLSVAFDVLSSRGLFEVSIWNHLDVYYMYTTCMLHVHYMYISTILYIPEVVGFGLLFVTCVTSRLKACFLACDEFFFGVYSF